MSKKLSREAQSLMRRRICGKVLPETLRQDLETPLADLTQLILRTVEYGESNSLLIIGPKGSGKTTLLERALEKVEEDNSISENLMEVRLNGLMQTDDRISLAEITRQLKLENTVGDRVFGSFSENLSFLLEALRSGASSSSCPILFVLDEFDLFALHKNQTLLYNLFDITQAGTTPLLVIGLTCRFDVMDMFEKRVKSRFSHRQIYISNSWTFEDYFSAFADCLKLPKDFARNIQSSKTENQKFCKKWNEYITRLLENPSLAASLESQFNICKEICLLHTALALPLSKLDPSRDVDTTASELVDAISFAQSDAKASILHGLSVLELCLIISMHHITNIYDEPFNFQMIYNEYLKFARRKSHILQNQTKPVIMKAYEHLIELELVKPLDTNMVNAASGGNAKVQKEYRLMSLLVEHSQLQDALHKYHGCPTDVRQWAMSSLD